MFLFVSLFSKVDNSGDILSALWGAVVDTADIAFTALMLGNSEEIYEGVSGKEVGSLTERNIMAKGGVDRTTSALNYAGDVLTGNKSAREMGTDALEAAWSGAKGVYSDFIEPFVKNGQYMLEDTHVNANLILDHLVVHRS